MRPAADAATLYRHPRRARAGSPGVQGGRSPSWAQDDEYYRCACGADLVYVCLVPEGMEFAIHPGQPERPYSLRAETYWLFLGNEVYLLACPAHCDPAAVWSMNQNCPLGIADLHNSIVADGPATSRSSNGSADHLRDSPQAEARPGERGRGGIPLHVVAQVDLLDIVPLEVAAQWRMPAQLLTCGVTGEPAAPTRASGNTLRDGSANAAKRTGTATRCAGTGHTENAVQ